MSSPLRAEIIEKYFRPPPLLNEKLPKPFLKQVKLVIV